MQDKECQASQCMVLHLVLYMQHLSEEPHLVLYMQHLSEELHLVLYMQHLSEELHLVLYMEQRSLIWCCTCSTSVRSLIWCCTWNSTSMSSLIWCCTWNSTSMRLLTEVLYMQHLSEELHLVLYMEQHLSEEPHLCDELVKLKCADVTFNPEGMVVKIESSKTDQYRDGASIVNARTGQVTCSVGMMEHYFRMGESELGFDPTLFGMHSLRAGAAIAAANTGVENRLFKRHGRWKSKSAKDGYVKDSLERRLEVSKGLGI
ncbi:hypothetical protein EMCRGX_G012974 [Ephydatia muelleri]